MRKTLAAVAVLLAFASSAAEARGRHHHHRHHAHAHAGRPAAWCGWFMRTQVGSDPGPQYNLARSWARYGSNAGGPSVGAIVVWRHHVGKIVGHENGQWIVTSGNDGHAVRTRPRSLAGAIAFRNAYASF
ncbi:C40 family peptidase [Bradyrhizobium sp. USDA 4454]